MQPIIQSLSLLNVNPAAGLPGFRNLDGRGSFALFLCICLPCILLWLGRTDVPAASTSQIELTEEQKHQGDLILVNADYAYDFDANASADLVSIREAQDFYYPLEKDEFQVISKVVPHLDEMIWDCNEAMGTSLTAISSAWRSRDYQQDVWDEYAELYGEDYSRQYVAKPGYSEHHTGLAVDLGILYEDGSEGTFSESPNAEWMADHSWIYGFVRRYAEDKVEITKISNEAWHFRYVGQPHATFMYEHNYCLEEYLEYLRTHSSASEPLVMEAGGRTYRVYYTGASAIAEPDGNYTISGDNTGGYIITSWPD